LFGIFGLVASEKIILGTKWNQWIPLIQIFWHGNMSQNGAKEGPMWQFPLFDLLQRMKKGQMVLLQICIAGMTGDNVAWGSSCKYRYCGDVSGWENEFGVQNESRAGTTGQIHKGGLWREMATS